MKGEEVSASNRVVKLARALKTRHGRDKHRYFLVEGARAVEELLSSSSHSVLAVIAEQSQAEKGLVQSCLHMAHSHALTTLLVDSGLFLSLAITSSPQGILAIAKDITVSLDEVFVARPKLVVVSDGVQDPGNMGTLLRVADAVGADAFVATAGSVDLYNPKVVRASMSSLFHFSICRDVEPDTLVEKIHDLGIAVIAADPYATVAHFDYAYPSSVAVIFGNEGRGLSACIKEQAHLVSIPMPGKAESLNVGVAAGILLYEVIRQWRSGSPCGVMGAMI